MLAHWIWLAHRPNLPDWLRWEILKQFKTPEAVYFADSYECVDGLQKEGLLSLQDKSLQTSQAILEACIEKKLQILTIADPEYPEKLKNISDPPLILYYKGRLPDFKSTAVVSVVGTRNASAYGLTVAQRMGYQLSKGGAIVVSGMALGIDAMAMQGALLGGSPVVGVLGCGADLIYPMKNRQLFQNMKGYGCIFSELPPGTKAAPWTFPRRNRIISGLSDGVLVVEAPLKSGALITARQALDQGRDVFVVPGNIGLACSEGSNGLLRQGAGAVGCGWDILSEYTLRYPGRLQEVRKDGTPQKQEKSIVAQSVSIPKKKPSKPEKTERSRDYLKQSPEETHKFSIDNKASQPYIDINDILQRCNSQEKAIVMALKDGETLVDTVIQETGIRTQEILADLTMLEIKGIIKRLPGRRICLQSKVKY